jgi:pimeloyl-ACP methyl ester carboxylesterase
MDIRDAGPGDAWAITGIYNDAVVNTTAIWNDTQIDVENRRAWLSDRQKQGYPVFVAINAVNEVVGYVSFGDRRAWDGYLAQSLRRAGWTVLTIHYRGSWGGPGAFSFTHCLQDAAIALDWLVAMGAAERIDSARIIVIGHSMGGFVAAQLCAARAELRGAVLLSGVDLGRAFGNPDTGQAVEKVDENVGTGAGLHILAGTSPGSLAAEARANRDRWRLTDCAARLADRPLLVVTSDDGFTSAGEELAAAVHAIDSAKLSVAHFATDHSYSDCRIALQVCVLDWLQHHYPIPSA